MIFRGAASRAVFNPARMGKSDLAVGEHLFSGLNALEPGQEHQPHSHCDRDKVYVILDGRGTLTIAEETASVEPGDVAFAAAGVVHSLSNPGPQRLVALVVMGPPPAQGTKADR